MDSLTVFIVSRLKAGRGLAVDILRLVLYAESALLSSETQDVTP